MTHPLPPLPESFSTTRDGLHRLACYAVAPARRAQTGRIGLRSTGDGFGTPPLPDGTRVLVRGDRLVLEPGGEAPITTVSDAARFLGIELSPDPGIGRDLPPFEPDANLAIDREASLALGAWYGFAQRVLDRVAAEGPAPASEAQLWPEHFDLALVVETAGGVNVGFSPGDTFSDEPYVYVGPHATDHLEGAFWNAPFGAFVPYCELVASDDPSESCLAFVEEGLQRA